MRQLFILAAAVLVATYSFADIQSSGFSKNSSQLNALGSAWKAQQSMHLNQGTNDITMVYGGADVSHRPTTAPITLA